MQPFQLVAGTFCVLLGAAFTNIGAHTEFPSRNKELVAMIGTAIVLCIGMALLLFAVRDL